MAPNLSAKGAREPTGGNARSLRRRCATSTTRYGTYAEKRLIDVYDARCQGLAFTCIPKDGGPPPDAAFYLTLMRERMLSQTGDHPLRVLELGSGTGRVSLALVQALEQIEVIGLDASPFMIDEANRKARALPAHQARRVRFELGDWADFDLGAGSFDLAVCPFNTFQLNTTIEAQDAFLRMAHRHLRPGGLLILDLFVPRMDRLARIEEPRRPLDVFALPNGERVIEHESVVRHPIEQTFDVCLDYLPEGDTTSRPIEHRFTMTWFFPRELRRMLAANRFASIEVLDGYAGGPVSERSTRQVVLGLRP